MVSYADLSSIKQPDAPVAVDLNDPIPETAPVNTKPLEPSDEWHGNWNQMHSKVLYFSGVTEDALPELQKLFKASRGIRLNVDPHSSEKITGNVEFRNVYDTEKAMVVLNNKELQSSNGILKMTPLVNNVDLGSPPSGGYISIKHIPETATESTLYDFLRPSGPIYSCSFPTHPNGQRKGIAHACFTDQQYAQIALEQLNFAEYLGNNVHIQISRPPRRLSKPGAGGSSRKNSVRTLSQPTSVSESEPQSRAQTPPSQQYTPATAPVPVPIPAPVPVPISAPARSLSRQSSVTYSQGRAATSPSSSEPSGGPGNGLGGVIVPGKLFVTNLHPTVSHKELFALFKKYGYIQSARVSIDPTTKKSRGHGIVQFSDPNAALDALSECQGADIKGRKITMYQYEHVNKQQQQNLPQSQSQSQAHTPMQPLQPSAQQDTPANGSDCGNSTVPTETDLAAAFEQSVAVSKDASLGQEQNTVPFPRSNSVASTSAPTASSGADALIDPTMLRNISESSRNEILTQKLISEIAANPAVDVLDASRIVDSFLKRPLEDILALLSDPRLLASEWDLEQKASVHMASYASPVLDSPVSQKPSPASMLPRPSDGIHLHDYDTEIEDFIEMLLSKTESERKTKLGSKLFPLIKGMGYRDSTKITVWILGHMSHDVRSLAYTLNDSAKLYALVEEAQEAINGAEK
ncbi:hypothetical protein IWW45_006825, partial [Coemansia sp. RSA 485]